MTGAVDGPHHARTRRELLGAAAAGALLAPVTAQAATTTSAAAPSISEPDRLARLIGLELLLAFCYRHVLASSVLGGHAEATLTPFMAHEQAHIAALERRLTARGGTSPAGPASVKEANADLAHRKVGGRLGQLKGDKDAVRLLQTLEQVTIGAYFVALTKVQDRELIVLLSQIMANEAQHDANLALLLPPYKPRNAVPYGLVQGLQ